MSEGDAVFFIIIKLFDLAFITWFSCFVGWKIGGFLSQFTSPVLADIWLCCVYQCAGVGINTKTKKEHAIFLGKPGSIILGGTCISLFKAKRSAL